MHLSVHRTRGPHLAMNVSRIPDSFLRRLHCAARLFVLVALVSPLIRAAESGGITGSVTSATTQNALQGAVVSIPSLHRDELTDNTGSFTFKNLPPGPAEVVITYTGFEPAKRIVNVADGATARFDTEMKSADLVTMERFTVASVKE